jgi:hypothetical protein
MRGTLFSVGNAGRLSSIQGFDSGGTFGKSDIVRQFISGRFSHES